MINEQLLESILNLPSAELLSPTLQSMHINEALLERIFQWSCDVAHGGKLASYIPELTKVNPNKKAIAIGDLHGNIACYGDGLNTRISFQSVIKPFLYIYALECGLSADTISSIEPTALHFNTDPILQPDSQKNRPGHPLNNAGAISSAGAIAQFDYFLEFMRQLTRNPDLQILDDIYQSEMSTNSNNRAIAYRLVATGRFHTLKEGETALANYTKACAIGVTPIEVLHAALVLANGGLIDGERVISRDHIVRAINVMNSYGLYENTGEISLMAAGARALSCKSGVSGLIINVDPGRGAFCTYSPLLDAAGNSLFGKYALIPLNNVLAAPAAMRLNSREILKIIREKHS